MARLAGLALAVAAATCCAGSVRAADRLATIGDSSPAAATGTGPGPYNRLVEIVQAMDRATHSTTRVEVLPFARALKETAAGHADFHLPFIQDGARPPPPGLAYVTQVDFGYAQFVIYSRKSAPVDLSTLAHAGNVETEPGHEFIFDFPVHVTYCVPCTLEKILNGRTDALVVGAGVVDPLLKDPRYRGIHRAPYKRYPLRALVPAKRDNAATVRYLVEGATRIKASGELWRILPVNRPYEDWQP